MVLEISKQISPEERVLREENINLRRENQRLFQDNKDLKHDLEDMKNAYLNDLAELNMVYQSLEEEVLDEKAARILQLESTLRDRNEYDDDKMPNDIICEGMLKAFASLGII